MTAEQLADAVRTADALMPTVSDPVTAAILESTPRRLKIIANYGVGYNNVDLAAAARLGIVVTNTPDVLTDDTADLTIALLLMTARRLSEGAQELRAGRWTGWRPTHLLGTRVTGKTLGILGLGRIGRAVARRAREGFGMRVIDLIHPSRLVRRKRSALHRVPPRRPCSPRVTWSRCTCRRVPRTVT